MGNKNTSHVELIAESFKKYFTEICPKLARGIETSSIKFDKYNDKCNITNQNGP